MKFTTIVLVGLVTIILFGVLTYVMSDLTNSTVWAGMCNTAWENGFMKIVIPFGMLGFGGALIYIVFKGKPDSNRFGGG